MSHEVTQKLFSWVEELLSKRLTVEQFEAKFYLYYVDEVPEDALSETEDDFFFSIQEKLDFTAEAPSQVDRSYGWIDHNDYVAFVRSEYEKFLAATT